MLVITIFLVRNKKYNNLVIKYKKKGKILLFSKKAREKESHFLILKEK